MILLGDKDQLASVEAGAVLGDICGLGGTKRFSGDFLGFYERVAGKRLDYGAAEGRGSGMSDAIISLNKSYRFGPTSGIGSVSRAVNAGDGAGAFGLMRGSAAPDMRWRDLPRPEALLAAIKDLAVSGFSGYFQPSGAETIFECFNRFRILCALRRGHTGSGR